MSTVDLSLNSICLQKKQRMLYTVPPNRYTPPNPYVQFPQFTQFQFDMRRKAEILQYNASASSTKTNNITKKGKWSQLVNGTIGKQIPANIVLVQMDVNGVFSQIIVKYPDTYTSELVPYQFDASNNPTAYTTIYTIVKGSVDICNDDLYPQPTSSSDVPGPIMNLIRDTTVPLYNYASKTGTYGIINSGIKNPWYTFTDDNIQFYNSIITKLFTLTIQNTISEYAYNYYFQTPVKLFFSGTTNNNPAGTGNNGGITLLDESSELYGYRLSNAMRITNVTVTVKYNGEIVTLTKTPTIEFDTTTINFTNDIENGATAKSFNAEIYMGLIKVSNLYLYTQSSYIYDINITVNTVFTEDANYASFFDNIMSGVYLNTTNNNTIQTNCVISTTASTVSNTGFLFSGL
jgi:hypothetical protein